MNNEQMEAEFARLLMLCTGNVIGNSDVEDMMRLLAAMRAEMGRLREDAERYRWLRSQHWTSKTVCVAESESIKLGHSIYSLERLDERIDTARRGAP